MALANNFKQIARIEVERLTDPASYCIKGNKTAKKGLKINNKLQQQTTKVNRKIKGLANILKKINLGGKA